MTQRLLGFAEVTHSGIDTVGDRDFALDFVYAAARCHTHLSRLATDVIDFTTVEFGYFQLDDQIACGSSLMPHKKNPDLFELVRGKASLAVGDLMQLFTLLKGLPAGYNRDLQEDRRAILETGPRLRDTLDALRFGLPHLRWNGDRTTAAVRAAPLQAVDIAEALVLRGVPFRTAYQSAGALVVAAARAGMALEDVTAEMATAADGHLAGEALSALRAAAAVGRKESLGGTGPAAVEASLERLEAARAALVRRAAQIPSLDALAAALSQHHTGGEAP